MKAKRFSEEQIIGVLKEAEAGGKTTAPNLASDVPQLEGEVRGDDGIGGPAAEGSRAGERQLQRLLAESELGKAALKARGASVERDGRPGAGP